MADAERRERERSASADEQAQLLRERLRSGELSEEALELCAYLGHGPAIDALGRPAPAGQFVPWDRWEEALSSHRVMWLAVLEHGCDELDERLCAAGSRPEVIEAIQKIRRWSVSGAGPLPVDSKARSRLSRAIGEGIGYRSGLYWLPGFAVGLEVEDEEGEEYYPDASSAGCVIEAIQPGARRYSCVNAIIRHLVGSPLLAGGVLPVEDDYLLSRTLRGELPEPRLRIAAEAGYEPAQRALEVPHLGLPDLVESICESEDLDVAHALAERMLTRYSVMSEDFVFYEELVELVHRQRTRRTWNMRMLREAEGDGASFPSDRLRDALERIGPTTEGSELSTVASLIRGALSCSADQLARSAYRLFEQTAKEWPDTEARLREAVIEAALEP